MTREDRGGHDGNLKNQKDVYDDEHDKEWEILNHRDRVGEVDGVREIRNEQMAENTHGRCSNDFVEREAQIRFEPSPEQELQLVEDEERNKDRPKNPNDRAGQGTIGKDDGDKG